MYSNESSIVSNLMMKFSNVPSFASTATATSTESSSSQTTPVFSANSSSTSQRATEERRNRKLKRQEKTKHQQKPQQQQQLQQKPQTVSVPEVIPLDDEYEVKKQKRLLRNRQAAQQSRERKKQKIMQLEEEMDRVVEENSQLRYRVQQLEALLKGSSTIFTSPSPESSATPVPSSGQLSFDSRSSQDEVLQYDELNTPVSESPSSPGFLNQESPENSDLSSFAQLVSSDECLWPSDFFLQSPQETLQNLQNLPRDSQEQRNLQSLWEDEQTQRSQLQFGTQQERQVEEQQRTQAYSSESAALSSFSLPMEEAQVLSTIQSTQVLQVICYLISLSWIQLSVLQFAAEQAPVVVAEQQRPQDEQSTSQSEQSTSVSSASQDAVATVARRPKSRWKVAQQQQFAFNCGRGSFNLALPVLVNTFPVC